MYISVNLGISVGEARLVVGIKHESSVHCFYDTAPCEDWRNHPVEILVQVCLHFSCWISSTCCTDLLQDVLVDYVRSCGWTASSSWL